VRLGRPNRFSISARIEACEATVCETQCGFANGETATSGSRNPSWSKVAQFPGYGPVGVKKEQRPFACVALMRQLSPPPGRVLAGGFERSAHCPGAMPSGVDAPPCGAGGGATWS